MVRPGPWRDAMRVAARWFRVAALAGLGVAGLPAPPARAQFRNFTRLPALPAPRFTIQAPLQLRQAAVNTAVVGQALSQIPPYFLGYNPYPQAAGIGLPTVPAAAFGNPYAATLATNPSLGSSTLMSNPYLGGGAGTATLSTNPYGGGGYGAGGYGRPHPSDLNPPTGYPKGAAAPPPAHR